MNTDTKEPDDGVDAVTKAMSRVLYNFVFGMTQENLKLHREVSVLIDESEHFPTGELRQAAKDAFRISLEGGSEVEHALADVFVRASGEERDLLFRRLAEVSKRAAAAAEDDDLAPGFVQEGNLSEETLASMASGEFLREEIDALGKVSEDLGEMRSELGDTPPAADRVEAAASAAADAASDAVKEAAAEAAEHTAEKIEGASEEAAKPQGILRRFAKSVAGAAGSVAGAVKRSASWTGRKAKAGYARTLAPVFSWVGRKAVALGLWMSTKPVLRQVAAGTAWTGEKIGQGFAAAGRFFRYVGRGLRRWVPAVAKTIAYTVLAVLAIIGAVVVALAVAIATGMVSVFTAADGEPVAVVVAA